MEELAPEVVVEETEHFSLPESEPVVAVEETIAVEEPVVIEEPTPTPAPTKKAKKVAEPEPEVKLEPVSLPPSAPRNAGGMAIARSKKKD